MKKFWKNYWPLIVAALLILTNTWKVLSYDKKHNRNESKVKVDSTTYVDTVPYLMPVPKDSLVLRYDTLKVPLGKTRKGYDSIAGDSVMEVTGMPITQNVYRDTSYIAWVSGYRPCLDSIKVFSTTHYVTKTITERLEPPNKRRVSVGMHVGYGLTPKGILPYLGLGVGYNFWP